ncbi:MAG: MBOAT family protein [Bacteroidetes bacterium]|nr:MBOAT family protein [Bacteroidota bacterium]
MAFNSGLFVAAFLLFYLVYYAFGSRVPLRIFLLVVFNCLFYFLLSGPGIGILVLLSLSDFFAAKAIHSTSNERLRRFWLYYSVITNIGLILLFRHFTDWFHWNEIAWWPKVIGISFFVFRSLGYVLDVFRENIESPETNWLHYFAYIGFFPLILAGPISPARDFMDQMKRPLDKANLEGNFAVFLLCSGIIKKYVLSNYLAANFVDRVFESPSYFSGIESLLATVGQALVVYLDFSGYTDLVAGMALLLGFKIAENFNFPYISKNITEYWRRWHMSLSKWLNEYLFFPMSFTLRKWKKTGTVIAVFITFVISGFWHGTAFHYTFWGMLHGVALVWDIISGGMRDGLKNKIPAFIYNPISILLTFSFLALSGIFFKAQSMEQGMVVMEKIFHTDFQLFPAWLQHYPWVFVLILAVFFGQIVLSGIYNRLLVFWNRIPAFFVAFILVATIFFAYQITGLGALPFIYLEF